MKSGSRVLLAALLAVTTLALVSRNARAQTSTERPRLSLEQNFPNPFAPGSSETIFTYTVPTETEVRLVIFNLLAQEIVTLVDEEQPPGRHRVAWDGLDEQGNIVPPGIYYYKLSAGGEERLRRLRVLSAFTPGAEAAPTADAMPGAMAVLP